MAIVSNFRIVTIYINFSQLFFLYFLLLVHCEDRYWTNGRLKGKENGDRNGSTPKAGTTPKEDTKTQGGHGTKTQGGHGAKTQGGHGTMTQGGHGTKTQGGHGTKTQGGHKDPRWAQRPKAGTKTQGVHNA